MDGNACQALACYVASFHFETPLGDINAKIIPSSCLPHHEVGYPTHGRIEKQNVLSRGFYYDLTHISIPYYLNRFVHDQSFLI